jgi:hypothetical protein
MRVRTAHAMDDVGEMFLRRLQKRPPQAQEALADSRDQHQEQTETRVALLGHMVSGWQARETPEQQPQAVDALIGGQTDPILAQCEAHLAYAGNNSLPCLRPLCRPHRTLCLDVLECFHPTSTSADTALHQAIACVAHHRRTRAARLPVRGEHDPTTARLALAWIPQRWWKAVTGQQRHAGPAETVDHRSLELCVLSWVIVERTSGDLWVAGSEPCSDYRQHLLSWEAYAQQVGTSCQQVGSAADPARFLQDLQTKLVETIRAPAAALPTTTALPIHTGEPVLRRRKKQPEPEGFGLIDRLLSERMPAWSMVDVLTDTEPWRHGTDAFGPLSGLAAQLTAPRQRSVTTTCCSGCSLGPTQTARAMQGRARLQVAYVHQRPMTEQQLLDARGGGINR